jgi:pimeloyl-ACP methyl ester carboxylesterase
MGKRIVHALLTTAAVFAPTAIITMATVLLASPAGAQQTNPAIGTWTGNLPAGPGLTLVFHFAADSSGALTGTLDSPDQGATGIPLDEVTFAGDSLKVRINGLGVEYDAALSADNTKFAGEFRQGGMTLPLEITKGDVPARQPRPQEPTGPLPYDTEEVTFHNAAAGITLAATLTKPRSPGTHPAAVLVSGSGPQDRDESLMGHKPFLVLADHLTSNGIAVLRYDDRGVAGSEGDFATATTADFVTDALAATEYLRGRPDIDADAVGLIGHSEGGLVAPAAAAQSGGVAWIVLLAGPGVPGEEILLAQIEKITRASGASEAMIARSLATQRRVHDVLRADDDEATTVRRLREVLRSAIDSASAAERAAIGSSDAQIDAYTDAQIRQVTSPWFRNFLRYDPRPSLEAVTVPVLALNGSLDLQVPPEQNLPEIEAALERAGNGDVAVHELAGLNHLFQTATLGVPAEYASIEETFSPTALSMISEWIVARFRH